MYKVLKVLAFILILGSTGTVFSQTGSTKVVVIPMAGDEANCTWRETPATPLLSFFNHITSSCEADERIISGGFRYVAFNTSKNCDVIASYPVLSQPQGWKVTWGSPDNTSECNTYTAKTYSFCCKS